MKLKREYLRLLDKSVKAGGSAITIYNSPFHQYRDEGTLILLSNSWELLAKATLVKKKQSIMQRSGLTITGEVAVHRLRVSGLLTNDQEDVIQQIISLRNGATHYILPPVPVEVMHHLLFFGCKFFRTVVEEAFPTHVKDLPENYLALSFGDLTTYAQRVQRLVSKIRKATEERRLVWLLERGIEFDGKQYITEGQFAKKYRGKRGIMKYLEIGKFINRTDMVRLVPIEAPKNFTADVSLRRGPAKNTSLPVVIQKTDVNVDYPHLTADLAQQVGKNTNFVAKMTSVLGMKGDNRYHQEIRTSKNGSIQKYNAAALAKLQQKLHESPDFNPYSVAAV